MLAQSRCLTNGNVKSDGLIIIAERNFCKKLSIANVRGDICNKNDVVIFSCVTDYKLWSRENPFDKNSLIVINISASHSYGDDVNEFVRFEINNNEQRKVRRKILLLTEVLMDKHCVNFEDLCEFWYSNRISDITVLPNIN